MYVGKRSSITSLRHKGWHVFKHAGYKDKWGIYHGWNPPEVREWCKNTCKGKFAVSKFRAAFVEEEDASLFMLTWMDEYALRSRH